MPWPGVGIAPYVTDRQARSETASVEMTADDATVKTAPVAAPRPAPREAAVRISKVSITTPEFHQRMRPVLADGTNVDKASTGFRSAEQFATVAYAARNTGIPFVLLKHRVLAQGQSLTAAIRASKPELDAKSEVNRARAEAEADLWSVGG